MLMLRDGSLLQRSASYLFGQFEELKSRLFAQRVAAMKPPLLEVPPRSSYRFKHSGNAGDIIYALPAAFSLAKEAPIELFLKLDAPARYGHRAHPLGNVTFNERMFSMMRPLLLEQTQIAACETFTGQDLDYDMDVMRMYPFPQHAGHIARWYFLTFATSANLGLPWLTVRPDAEYSDHIVIARSQRYHAPTIDYSFLRRYPKLIFVGVEAEYEEIRRAIPAIKYRPVADFLELARVIAGARLFIGNQSFPYAIAEALKARRLLEVCHLCPNVIVEGPNGHDFCYQPQFETLVARLMR